MVLHVYGDTIILLACPPFFEEEVVYTVFVFVTPIGTCVTFGPFLTPDALVDPLMQLVHPTHLVASFASSR